MKTATRMNVAIYCPDVPPIETPLPKHLVEQIEPQEEFPTEQIRQLLFKAFPGSPWVSLSKQNELYRLIAFVKTPQGKVDFELPLCLLEVHFIPLPWSNFKRYGVVNPVFFAREINRTAGLAILSELLEMCQALSLEFVSFPLSVRDEQLFTASRSTFRKLGFEIISLPNQNSTLGGVTLYQRVIPEKNSYLKR